MVEGLCVGLRSMRWFVVPLVFASALFGCGRQDWGALQVPVLPGRLGAREASPIPGMVPTFEAVQWPTHSQTLRGRPADPINIVVVGSERHMRHVFAITGWVTADPITPITSARMVKAALTGGQYPTSPISPLMLYGKQQLLGYQKNAIGVKARDHLRVWRTPLADAIGRPVWAIGATKDVAIKWGPSDRLPTHQVAPDIDSERELVVNDFLRSGHVALRYQIQSLTSPFHGVNGTDDQYFTDGKVEVLELSRVND